MNSKLFVGLLIAIGFTLNGCGPVNYSLKKIPDTQSNRQAFRECQHTLAVASGYDSDGYRRLFKDCTSTIESTTETVQINPENNPPAGCQMIQEYGNFYYFFCK
jgi:hypothetical protein